MSDKNENFGLMEGAFFVSKNDILNWVKSNFSPGISKIEDACNGVMYCNILNEIYPKKVKMNKVNKNAKLEHESLANFKILQQGFISCNISKNIEVEKLVKGKYQDNLEFLQWMKRYYDLNHGGSNNTGIKEIKDYKEIKEEKKELENLTTGSKKRDGSKGANKAIVKKKESTTDFEKVEREKTHDEVSESNKKRNLSKDKPMFKKQDKQHDKQEHNKIDIDKENIHNTNTSNKNTKKKQTTSPTAKKILSGTLPKINQLKNPTNLTNASNPPTSKTSNVNVEKLKFENNNDLDVISQKFLKCTEELMRVKNENSQLKSKLERLNITNENINEENSKFAIELKKIEMIVKNEEKQDPKNVVNMIKQIFGDNDLMQSIDFRKKSIELRKQNPSAKLRPTTGKLSVGKNQNNSKGEYMLTKNSELGDENDGNNENLQNMKNKMYDLAHNMDDMDDMEDNNNHSNDLHHIDNNNRNNHEIHNVPNNYIDNNLHTNEDENENHDHEHGENEEENEDDNMHHNNMDKFKYLQKDVDADSDDGNDGGNDLKEIELDRNVGNSDDDMFHQQEKYLAVHNLDNSN